MPYTLYCSITAYFVTLSNFANKQVCHSMILGINFYCVLVFNSSAVATRKKKYQEKLQILDVKISKRKPSDTYGVFEQNIYNRAT